MIYLIRGYYTKYTKNLYNSKSRKQNNSIKRWAEDLNRHFSLSPSLSRPWVSKLQLAGEIQPATYFFVSNVLLKRSHTHYSSIVHSCSGATIAESGIGTETTQSAKPKVLIIWPLTEKIRHLICTLPQFGAPALFHISYQHIPLVNQSS